MFSKYVILFCVILLAVNIDAFVRRDVTHPQAPPDPIDALKKNMDALRSCFDQSLSKAVGDVSVEKHLQPVFNVIGDQLNRFSKAFDDLTAPSSSPASLFK